LAALSPSITARLNDLLSRHEDLGAELSDPEVISDQNRFRKYSQEYAQLEPVVGNWQQLQAVQKEQAELHGLAQGDDSELREMARAEMPSLQAREQALVEELRVQLLPRDARDDANIYLEIRAGTGGDEAAIFAGDLFAMYERYVSELGWQLEVLSANQGEHGGFKEVIARVVGHGAYSRLKFEAGTHRVQRVPDTESQGRIHTSACTVAILAEADDVEDVEVASSDLRIDTYRASGAGGQHVNKTDSAVRITHLPTGTVVECQEERSQHKNRARAMSLLKTKLLDEQRQAQNASQAADRKAMVGSGDRSERIRTYNFPQGRITDHRINLTLYRLEAVLGGDLDLLIDPLTQESQALALAALGD
jgi:peptide chain release factor 1